MKILPILCALAVFLGSYGCGRSKSRNDEIMERQNEIVENAVKEVPLLSGFQNTFPTATHFITHIAFQDGSTTWNSKVGLFQRYVLQMTASARVDRDTLKVLVIGEPCFRLREVEAITALPDGRQEISYASHITFNATDWKKLEASGGDFSVLGIKLKKEEPITGFSDYSSY